VEFKRQAVEKMKTCQNIHELPATWKSSESSSTLEVPVRGPPRTAARGIWELRGRPQGVGFTPLSAFICVHRRPIVLSASPLPVAPSEYAAAISDMIRMPARPRARPGYRAGRSSRTADQHVAGGQVEKAPQDIHHRGGQAFAGGFAKGLWKACPEIPLPRCGRALARNAPPKKYAT